MPSVSVKTSIAASMPILLASLVAGPGRAHEVVDAVESEIEASEKDWSVDFAPYVWVANINGTTTAGGAGIIDLLTLLNGMVMADLEIHYKRFGVIADGAWVEVTASDTLTGPFFTAAQTNLGMAFGTGAVSWQLRPKKGLALDPYIGARWWRVHPNIVFAGGIAAPRAFDAVDTWADFVVGLRLKYDINEKWSVRFTGDVGGGTSKVTWQGYIAGGYAFTDWFALEVGHRVIGVDNRQGAVPIDIIIHGLQTGFHFTL